MLNFRVHIQSDDVLGLVQELGLESSGAKPEKIVRAVINASLKHPNTLSIAQRQAIYDQLGPAHCSKGDVQ